VKKTNAFKRYKWQYQQIAYPYDTIPMYKYSTELKKEVNKINSKLRKIGEEVEWSPIGPTGIENPRWCSPLWGVSSGRVRAVAVHPTDPLTLYIGAASGGIWKTTNGGNSWEDIGSNESKMFTFGAISIDPNNPDIIYAGTGEITAIPNMRHYGKGLFKSTNGGLSWFEPTDTFGTITGFGELIVSPYDSNIIYAALGSGYILLNQNQPNEGIWKSTDAGSNWTRTLDVQDAYDIVVHPTSPDTVYAAIGGNFTTSGFYISIDGGESWDTSNTGLQFPTTISRMHIDIAKSSPNILYAVIYDGMDNTPKAYKSINSGKNWFQISVGTQLGGNFGWGWIDVGYYALCISVDPNDPDHVFIGNIELHETTNGADFTVRRIGGNTANQSVVHVDYHCLIYAPSDANALFIGCDGGIYKSPDNGASFINLNNDISTIQFYRIASHPNNENIMIGGAQDNWSSITFDLTSMIPWVAVTEYDGMECFFDYDYPDSIVYTASQNGRLWKSTDGGHSFNEIANINGSWITPFFMHPEDYLTLYSASNRILCSSNGGSNWSIISGSQPVVQHLVASMAQSKVNPNNMILSGGAGSLPLPTNPEVKVSNDGGYTWIDVTANIPGEPRWIPRVVTHPSDTNTMYIVRSGLSENNKIYMTSNLGDTWTNISGDLPNLPCWDLFVDPFNTEPNNTNHLYAGMDVGVYRSIDGGISWQYVSEDIPLLPVWDFDYVEYGYTAKLRVGTYGRSAYETEWYILQPPSAPFLIAPGNNSIIDSTSVLFVWKQSVPDVEKYWFELDINDQFNNSFIDSTLTDTSFIYSSLQMNQRYWWRVKAKNIVGWGDFSEVRTFDVITGVESEIQQPIEFSLMQNYPNPFNPVTTIKYSIKERSTVKLILYDVLGKEIKVLVNKEQDAGDYGIDFNAGNLVSGIYFYQLKAGDFIETKKMVLLR
jgi:photosystem II stability/assembly factor-like uncharacterized protein